MPLPDFRSRMLPMTFTAPSLATFILNYDRLEREGGKKAATNEILDSDISITQDQGNQANRFPVEVYFTGDDYDLQADGFFAALSEEYSRFNAGTLLHPRWGPIQVMPVKWKQSESFVSGQRRANFSVEFVRVYPFGGIFATISKALSQVVTLTNALKIITPDNLTTRSAQAVAGVRNVFSKAISSAKDFMDDLLVNQSDLLVISNNISSEASNLLNDPVDNFDLLLSQVYRTIDLPSTLEDDTFSKINTYSQMIDDLIVDSTNTGDVSAEVRRNKAIVGERIVGYAVAAQCVSALYTEFSTRSDAISAIETLEESYDKFAEFVETSKVQDSNLGNTYSGNSEFMEGVYDVYTRSIATILENSFDLSAEVSVVLSEKSDPITLTYKYYRPKNSEDLERSLDLFFKSNMIEGTEFIELESGREVVFYVN